MTLLKKLIMNNMPSFFCVDRLIFSSTVKMPSQVLIKQIDCGSVRKSLILKSFV